VLGARFEAEIREQPDVWRRIAASRLAESLVPHLRGTALLFLGSGSSLFAAQLAALAFRRRGLHAAALAATEARFDAAAYRDATVVALSQSGKSADLIAAIQLLEPALLVALTNDAGSPLAALADVAVDVLAGPEVAVPASKSVTSMIAILLWAASILGGGVKRTASSLHETAGEVEAWLAGPDVARVAAAANALANERGVVVVGAGYGGPVASEIALKIKEASYVHAEGFPAGEFRHGSSAMLDASTAIVGIVDEASRDIVERPLAEAARTGAARFVIGASVGDIPRLGPVTDEAFNTLGWLVTGQVLALALGRARGVESDAPRGLSKALV
jgi:glucosamine--fructose-6-phosphate aminotransferase (isomerizing)